MRTGDMDIQTRYYSGTDPSLIVLQVTTALQEMNRVKENIGVIEAEHRCIKYLECVLREQIKGECDE